MCTNNTNRPYFDFHGNNLSVFEITIAVLFCRFEDVIDVQVHNRNVVQINLKDRSVVFYTNRVRPLISLNIFYCPKT